MSRLLAACLFLAVAGCDDKDSGEDGGGGDVDYDTYKAQCEALDNADDCRGHPIVTNPGVTYRCIWAEWVPVVYDGANDVCEFGEVEARCEVDHAGSVGCAGGGGPGSPTCSDVGALALRRDHGGTIELTKAPFCLGGFETCELDQDEWTHAECACLCDPGYPGASG